MSEEKQNKNLKAFKVIFISLVIIVGLQLVGRLLLISPWVHNFVKNKIVSVANESLNAELSIDNLSGDLWKEILLNDVVITQADTVFKADSIYARYDILSFLGDRYEIDSVKAVGIFSRIEEQEDTTFNVQKLVKESEPEEEASSDPVNFLINKIALRNINTKVYSPSYLPDSTLAIKELNADAYFRKDDTVAVSLSSLDFLIKEGRLPQPVSVQTSGSYVEQKISLQELVIETGRSMLQTKADANLSDSTLTAETRVSPFSLEDAQPYLSREIPPDQIQMQLDVSGSLKNLSVGLRANGTGVENLEISADLAFENGVELKKFRTGADYLDISYFTMDSVDAELGPFSVSGEGSITQEVEQAYVDWRFNFADVRFREYELQSVNGAGSLENQKLDGEVRMETPEQELLTLAPAVNRIFGDRPDWSLRFTIESLNLANWVDTDQAESQIFLAGEIEGSGFELPDSTWQYRISNKLPGQSSYRQLVIAEEQISQIEISGKIGKEKTTVDGLVQLDKSKLMLDVTAKDILEEVPYWDYLLRAERFDVSEINQLSDFPTSLNVEIQGNGRGKTPEECVFTAAVLIDSSVVNGASFREFSTSVEIANGILTITDGTLDSDIIAGSFKGRKNIADPTDPGNRLTVNMTLKDAQPLAPLVNVTELQAMGHFQGDIIQDSSGVLSNNFELDLNTIRVDTLFSAERIHGNAAGQMKQLSNFELGIKIQSPVIQGMSLQDIELDAGGVANEDTLNTNFELELIGGDRGRLVQEGNIAASFPQEKFWLRFDVFDFYTPGSMLALEQPYHVQVEKQAITTDTLKLSSTTGAYLNFSVPYADSLEQHAMIDGRNFDFGVIQEIIFGEHFLDGILSGRIVYNKSPEELTGNGNLNLGRLNYRGVEADSIDLDFKIIRERLTANVSVRWDNQEKITGLINVPFVLSEDELTDEFYTRSISGSLTIEPSDLSRFRPLLDDAGLTETNGILSFAGSMEGTAGEPAFEGDLALEDPVLSGISLDTVSAGFSYDHVQDGLKVNALIKAAEQEAARIDVDYPMSYDFRNFKLNLPAEEDTITIVAKTDQFNVAVFNDFLNDEYMDDLEGTLNANVRLEGPAGGLVPEGYITYLNGSLEIPIAGIELEDFKSDIELTSEGLRINNLSAKSGPGSFKSSGLISMDGISPKTVDIKLQAGRFQLANTADYNMIIDVNSRLSGDVFTPEATGKITVKSGFFFLQDFGEKEIEDVQLEGEEEISFSAYDSLAIDMELEIERNFFIRNRGYLDMEIELRGLLDAEKSTNGELSLFGSLNGVEGYVSPLGKLFNLEEANLTFSGPPDNPEIYVKSTFTPQTRQRGEPVTLYYIIEGPADDPDYRFESDPQMEQQDIICYTLFAKPCNLLESWQGVFASNNGPTATDVLADVLLDQVEALATRELGVDVVQIDNSGANGGTSIKTGWYINQRTFFAIINELSGARPDLLFILEYVLSESWDLIITQGEDSRNGIDFRYQFDY